MFRIFHSSQFIVLHKQINVSSILIQRKCFSEVTATSECSRCQHIACRCCSSVMALMVLDRYGIVNQWPLQEADPSCLLAHHWVLRFICSIPGCLSFPEGTTQHAPFLFSSQRDCLRKRVIVGDGEKQTTCVLLFDVSELTSICTDCYIKLSAHAKDKLGLCLL